MRIHKHKMPNQMCSHKLNCMFPFQLQKWSPLIWQHQITRNSLWIWSVCSEEEWIAISSFLFFFPHRLHEVSIFFQPEEQLQPHGAKADSRTANKGAGAQNPTEKASMAQGRAGLAALTYNYCTSHKQQGRYWLLNHCAFSIVNTCI